MITVSKVAVVEEQKCIACNICVRICPVEAIRIEKRAFKESETVPPCEMFCPINQDIRKWVGLAQEGKFEEAWQAILEKNPLPAVLGRVCPHFCENNCNSKDFDEAVAIMALEKFIGDEALRRKWSLPIRKIEPDVRKIAVIGSGPAGLSCTYQLARKGYKVTIFEEFPVIGGMLSLGIPDYRLPKTILMPEIENNILSLGVEVEKNIKVDDYVLNRISPDFDAIFIAVGAQKGIKLNIDGENAKGVISGLDFLKKINLGQAVEVGKEVTVIGGGNTAIDAARSALKLGAKVAVFYRRSSKEMPAIESEVKEAEQEGVEIQMLTTPVKIITQNARVTGLECIKMRLGEKDESGRARPSPIENSNFSVQTDMVIVATGEEARSDFHINFEKDLKIFTGEVVDSVAAAIKSGEKVAKQVLFYLREGKRISSEEKEQPEVIEFKDLNLSYFEPQACQSKITSHKSAIDEARRCFSCGWCLALIDEQGCLDCKLCFIRCPKYAITMAERDIPMQIGTTMAGVSEEAVARICEAAHMYPDQIICFCHRVQAKEIAAAILQGAKTPEDISRATGARTGCGVLCITGILRLLKAAGVKLTKAPGYQWYDIKVSIWEIPAELQQKYPEYYLAEDLRAINSVFPGGSKS